MDVLEKKVSRIRDLRLWLCADDVAIALSANSPVDGWFNRAIGFGDAFAITRYGVPTLNDVDPSINNHYSVSLNIGSFTVFLSLHTEITVFLVVKPHLSSVQVMVQLAEPITGFGFWWQDYWDGVWNAWWVGYGTGGPAFAGYTNGAYITSDSWNVLSYKYSSQTIQIAGNGVNVPSVTRSGGPPTVNAVISGNLTVGAGANGDYPMYTASFAEVLLFDHPLTPLEESTVRAYLLAKYGLSS